MMALVTQHEFAGGWCLHCGAKYHAAMTATCLPRAIPADELRPEPARRQLASESFDEIGARLAELEKERLAAVNSRFAAEPVVSSTLHPKKGQPPCH